MTASELTLNRFFAKTIIADPQTIPFWTGEGYEEVEVTCRIWTGATSGSGYGRFWDTREECWTAHRFAYTIACGEIPCGYEVDHLCRNRGCVEPKHLEPVTPDENLRRQHLFLLTNGNCRNSHTWSENTAFNSRGKRYCLQCNRDRVKRSREYQRAKRARERKPRVHSAVCLNGHDRTANTYTSPRGKQNCRRCVADAARRYKERKAAQRRDCT